MESCPFKTLADALDRLLEARWHLANAKDNYHEPEGFRFSINGFLRAIKEVPHILSQEMQNDPYYKSKIKPVIEEIRKDNLFHLLSKKRDFIVHQSQLDCKSSGMIGATEIRIDKMAMSYPIHPNESSKTAYLRFLKTCKEHPDVRGLLGPDCDSFPFVQREWKLEEFDEDLFDVCATSFINVAKALNRVLEMRGAIALDEEKLDVGNSAEINRLIFDRDYFFEYMKK
jgi:hypothetical protein